MLSVSVLSHNWWAFLIRGLLGVLFGILALLRPGVTMLSLALVFGAYVFADGIFAIISAVRAANARERWGLLVLEGIVSLVAGAASIAWPGLTVLFFVTLMAVWALMKGALLLGAAFNVDAAHGRWWMVLGAIVSLLLGVALVRAPLTGALVFTWWIGAFALIFGVAMLLLAFRLKAEEPKGGGFVAA